MSVWSRHLLIAGIALVATPFPALAQGAPTDDYPADAKPGQCFARAVTAAETNVVKEQVLVQPERTITKKIPAVFDTVEERVLVQQEQTLVKTIPATYKTVTEDVVVVPEQTVSRTIPAVTRYVDTRELVTPEREEWGKCDALGRPVVPNASATATSGQVVCKILVPAQYRVVRKLEIVTPARTEDVVIPAKVKKVTKSVVDQPSRTETVTVPPVWTSVKVRKLVTPEREETVTVPAEFKEVSKTIVVKPAVQSWTEVVCGSKITKKTIVSLQLALKSRGYYAGGVDGVFGETSIAAMERFQKASGLPVGYFSVDTAKALGIVID